MAKNIVVFNALAQKDKNKPEILFYSFLVEDMDTVKDISWQWLEAKEKEGYRLVQDDGFITLLWTAISSQMVKEAAADG